MDCDQDGLISYRDVVTLVDMMCGSDLQVPHPSCHLVSPATRHL